MRQDKENSGAMKGKHRMKDGIQCGNQGMEREWVQKQRNPAPGW